MADPIHILVVEDDRDLASLLSYNLRRAGHEVDVVHSGRAALDAASVRSPGLVLLDVMLPELSGTEVASRLRSNPATASVPILMLTARGEEVDQIVGLTVGADDYITKPFSMKVLLARVHALLRRAARASGEERSVSMGGVVLNLDTHEAMVHGERVHLTLTEFRLLASLIHAGGRVLTRSALMGRAMGPGVLVTERTIDVHITALRRKLGDQGGLIKTVRGVGYRASPELEEDAPQPDAKAT
jgi:DNA-binding response OmpR family regulator